MNEESLKWPQPVAIERPSGAKARLRIWMPVSAVCQMGLPLSASRSIKTEPSPLPANPWAAAMVRPSGEYATACTAPASPRAAKTSAPVRISRTTSSPVRSSPTWNQGPVPVAIRVPSGANATHQTSRPRLESVQVFRSEWPSRRA